MSRTFKLGVAALAAASVMTVPPSVADGSSGGDRSRGDNLRVIGLAGNGTKLVRFDADKPGYVRASATVRGLTGGDTKLVGIDYRVQDNKLYGVGNDAASAGVYSIDASTGRATLFTTLTVALSGSTFGVDFNPAANALRVVSDNGRTCANLSPSCRPPPSPTSR